MTTMEEEEEEGEVFEPSHSQAKCSHFFFPFFPAGAKRSEQQQLQLLSRLALSCPAKSTQVAKKKDKKHGKEQIGAKKNIIEKCNYYAFIMNE